MAHKWARWLHNPCRMRDPRSFRARDRIKSGLQVGKVASLPLLHRGVPTASQWGTQSEVAYKRARWLHKPCCIGGSPTIQSGGQNQRWSTSGPVGYITPAAWGVPTALERGTGSEVAHKWARWLHNPCRLGVPNTSEWGTESAVTHKWARWRHNTCRLGSPHRFGVGGTIKSGPQMGRLAA